MNQEKLTQTDSEDLPSFVTAAQKFYIHIRQTSSRNDTIDISTSINNDEADQPDPLRIPEIIIVICVLLLWCASILIFIRHSQLLRIRHRDLPFRAPVKLSVNLNHIHTAGRTSDAALHSKSCISSTGGVTPPIGKHMSNEYKHGEPLETLSLSISPSSRKCRHSLDINMTSMKKSFVDKHDDKEQLLHPHPISVGIKESLLEAHRRSIENLHWKSHENSSSIKYSTCYSTSDITSRQQNESHHSIDKNRSIQESPV